MRKPSRILLNTGHVELWPAHLLRARGNRDARALASAGFVLRRKRDGRYLAAELPAGLLPLVPRLAREAGLDHALDVLDAVRFDGAHPATPPSTLPLDHLHPHLDVLGIDAEHYRQRTGLALVGEPAWLAFAGLDRYRRPLWLHPLAARRWRQIRTAALEDEVVLEAVSGYRSHAYQLGIFERKLAGGQRLDDILGINAAPGFSEHHSGCAIDIGTPGEPSAETSFENTAAFAWLAGHAGRFGFRMSYPRDNPNGIVYEPWHWYLSLDRGSTEP